MFPCWAKKASVDTTDEDGQEIEFLANNNEAGAQWAQEQAGIALLSKWSVDSDGATNYDNLIKRIYDIYSKNPWMMSKIKYYKNQNKLSMLIPESRLNVSYDSKNLEISESCQFVSQEVNPKFFESSTDMVEIMTLAEEGSVKMVKIHLRNPEKVPLTKITVIRDSENLNSMKKIAVIVSISHILGDGATLYEVYNMLSAKQEVYSIQAERIEHEEEMQSTTSFVGKNGKAWTDQFYEASMGPFIKKSLYRQWKNKDGYYDCRGWMYKVDQKEIEKIKNEYKLLAEPNKFISTNDILVHWMFSFNKKADWVIVAVDMRPRLESLKKSKSFLAGNYLACPALRPEDISSPENIRKAMNDIFAKKYNNGYLDVPTGKQLMKYNSGTSTNWCKFYKEVELPGFKLEYCVPHFSTKFEKVSGVIPTMEETIIIFKMNSVDIGVNVLSASGRITSEMLDDKTKSPVLGECIMPELNYHRQPGAFQ